MKSSLEGGKRREGKQGTARKRKGRRKKMGNLLFPKYLAWYECMHTCVHMHTCKCRVVSFNALFTVLISTLQTRIVNVFKLLGVWGLFLGQRKDTDTYLSRLPASRLTEGKTKANEKETVASQSADPQRGMKLGTPGYSNETCCGVWI